VKTQALDRRWASPQARVERRPFRRVVVARRVDSERPTRVWSLLLSQHFNIGDRSSYTPAGGGGVMPAESVDPAEQFPLTLTRAQLKILYTVLKTYYDDLGHEEGDIQKIVRSILAQLPSEQEIRAIELKLDR